MGKKYLYVPRLPEQYDALDKMILSFAQKAFMTDSALFFLVDANENYSGHLFRKVVTLTGSCCNVRLLLKQNMNVEQLLREVDFYIANDSPDEIIYIRAAILTNTEILGLAENVETLFDAVPVNPNFEREKINLTTQLEEDVFKKFPPSQFDYFIFDSGLGESVAFFFWLKEYRRQRGKKILTFCRQKPHQELMDFCPYADVTVKCDGAMLRFIITFFSDKYVIHDFTVGTYAASKILEEQKKFPTNFTCSYEWIIEHTRIFLGISPTADFERYPTPLPENKIRTAKETFAQMGLVKGKTVFVNKEGGSFNTMPYLNNFWIKLAARLKAAGYELVTNSAAEVIPGCRNVFLSLLESSAFVGLCGNIISVPTGFIEACCIFNVTDKINWLLINPNSHDIYWKRVMNSLWYRINFDKIKFHGSKFVDEDIASYQRYMKKYQKSNVELSCWQWGDTESQNDALIEQLVGKITGRG